MSSLFVEDIIFTSPAGSSVGVRLDEINIREINVDSINERTTGAGVSINGGTAIFNDTTQIFTEETVTTTDATPTTLYSMATTSNTAYSISVEILAATAAGDTAAFKRSIKVKNVSGTVTAGLEYDSFNNTDTALNTASVSISVVGTNILVIVTGIALTSVKWGGEIKQVYMSF